MKGEMEINSIGGGPRQEPPPPQTVNASSANQNNTENTPENSQKNNQNNQNNQSIQDNTSYWYPTRFLPSFLSWNNTPSNTNTSTVETKASEVLSMPAVVGPTSSSTPVLTSPSVESLAEPLVVTSATSTSPRPPTVIASSQAGIVGQTMTGIQKVGLYDTTVRTTSFAYAKMTTIDKNTYLGAGLFIGMIPHAGADEIINFVRSKEPTRPLSFILSTLEPSEAQGYGYIGIDVVKPEEWAARGIEVMIVPMRDFTPDVEIPIAVEAVLKLRACIESNQSAFVHCKAGRSRSATFAAAYMCVYVINPATNALYTLDEAIADLKNKRPEVSIDEPKKAKAQEIINAVKLRLSNTQSTPTQSTKDNDLKGSDDKGPVRIRLNN